MSFAQELVGRGYDALLARTEARGLRAWREALVGELSGDVVEFGAGTGLNLAHYGHDVERIVLVEPAPHMRGRLRARLLQEGRQAEVVEGFAESQTVAPHSADVVVATLLLCSVRDPLAVLEEFKRVLKPGGQYVFIEHVAAPRGTIHHTAQRWIEPVWRRVAGDCRLTRDTEATLRSAGFQLSHVQRDPLPAAPGFVSPAIRGVARLE